MEGMALECAVLQYGEYVDLKLARKYARKKYRELKATSKIYFQNAKEQYGGKKGVLKAYENKYVYDVVEEIISGFQLNEKVLERKVYNFICKNGGDKFDETYYEAVEQMYINNIENCVNRLIFEYWQYNLIDNAEILLVGVNSEVELFADHEIYIDERSLKYKGKEYEIRESDIKKFNELELPEPLADLLILDDYVIDIYGVISVAVIEISEETLYYLRLRLESEEIVNVLLAPSLACGDEDYNVIYSSATMKSEKLRVDDFNEIGIFIDVLNCKNKIDLQKLLLDLMCVECVNDY